MEQEVIAILRGVKIAPNKLRIFTKTVRSKFVNRALDVLLFSKKKVAVDVRKLLQSAVANAVNNYNLQKEKLFIKEIWSTKGRMLKRSMPRAKGRMDRILRRFSHLTIKLCERREDK